MKKEIVTKKQKKEIEPSKPECGLCGKKTKPRTRTECCGNWICDDEDDYVIFSYARTCCSRNHRRMTLCGYHHNEGHKGDWKSCKECRKDFEPEITAWYGTNEYNFEKVPNPPKFKPTKCVGCGEVISLANDGYSYSGNGYSCERCAWSDYDARADAGKRK